MTDPESYEEDGTFVSSSHGDASLSDDHGDDWELTTTWPLCCCCSPKRFYHLCYVVLFCLYIVVFPLWAKWLIVAPKPYRYWNNQLMPFPMLPMRKTYLANDELPGIDMSAFPTLATDCNYSCGEDYLDYRSNLMNFDVGLMLKKTGLEKEMITTTFPVLLSSDDFVNWQLVADRRDANPTPFFRTPATDRDDLYRLVTGQCMGMPGPHESLTSEPVYIISCVAWRYSSIQALMHLQTATNKELTKLCAAVGGVCGWPCGSSVPSDRLPGCDANGVIESLAITEHVPIANNNHRVEISACRRPHADTKKCIPSTARMSQWPCHQCRQEEESEVVEDEEDEESDGMREEEDMVGDGDEVLVVEDVDDDFPGLFERRRLQDLEEVILDKRYLSLPQLQVRMHSSRMPSGEDVANTPRSFIFAAHHLGGPWTRIFAEKQVKSVLVGEEVPERMTELAGDFANAMNLEQRDQIVMKPESCFGKRGPLYLVACAVNSSIYDDTSLWKRNTDFDFMHGQKVAPPPFNDRCVAVAGRCGHACSADGLNPTMMPFCQEDGSIQQSELVGSLRIQYNRVPTVLIAISVLLCGFAVKTLMLCPGVFAPYKHAHDYDAEMTESFRYIVVVSQVEGADEGKGTMLRNIIGTVSCMPPKCCCRYHVVVNDEGHRNEMKTCFQLLCSIIEAVPDFGGNTYEHNLLEFMQTWCKETKLMSLLQIGGKVKELDTNVLDRLTGKSTLRLLLNESRWRMFDMNNLYTLERAMENLAANLKNDYNTFTPSVHYLDNITDWEPRDLASVPLRMHYTSRARPLEDSRNLLVQHVAVGSWYYKVPVHASIEDWLMLRTNPKEMVYALPDDDEEQFKVPLRSSHGRAGGLNFVDNYMTVVAGRPENAYGDFRDESPSLFAIADGRHQFQSDFMTSTIPCFFKVDGTLNPRVAFTQVPQYYPDYTDSRDFMDYNNAQALRLNGMIRNCCGGVSCFGTNAVWLIPPRDNENIWEKRVKRIRDQDKMRREQLIEREYFHTSSKIEGTASTLNQYLAGRYSHFISRKVSIGMAKGPADFIGAQQRWMEGAVTLALQWYTANVDSRGIASHNGWMLWVTSIMCAFFVALLVRLVTWTSKTSLFVDYGIVTEATFNGYFHPIRDAVWAALKDVGDLATNRVNKEVYEILFEHLLIWSIIIVAASSILFTATTFTKALKRWTGVYFPNEMRWWGRLTIFMDNLSCFMWFWTSFFWVGFNYYGALTELTFCFSRIGMMAFMLVLNLLNWGLVISNSFRYSRWESVDINEVSAMSMDNIWRSNQLFFMTGPLQLFSLCRGISEFIKYRFYGQDIGTAGDLGTISVNIVKYWTTLMLMGCVGVWICFGIYAHNYDNSLSACVVITMISLDVLHPCVFLWLGHLEVNHAMMRKMRFWECLTSRLWWQLTIREMILNTTLTNLLKFLAPAYFFMLPFLVLCNSYFGLTGAYMLVAMGPSH